MRNPRFLAVLLALSLSACSTTWWSSKSDKKDPPPKVEQAASTNKSLLVDRDGLIRIKFNPLVLPREYASVEIIFNSQYHGYFNLKDEIFLPRVPGRHKLTAIFSDADGNRIGDPKNYFIEVP